MHQQMVCRVCTIPGVLGISHGTVSIRRPSRIRTPLALHSGLLRDNCHDDLFCRWGAYILSVALVYGS